MKSRKPRIFPSHCAPFCVRLVANAAQKPITNVQATENNGSLGSLASCSVAKMNAAKNARVNSRATKSRIVLVLGFAVGQRCREPTNEPNGIRIIVPPMMPIVIAKNRPCCALVSAKDATMIVGSSIRKWTQLLSPRDCFVEDSGVAVSIQRVYGTLGAFHRLIERQLKIFGGHLVAELKELFIHFLLKALRFAAHLLELGQGETLALLLDLQISLVGPIDDKRKRRLRFSGCR